jgi:radical SAM superfamily enzyme YgiQ (UPF0313 family)
LASTAAWLRAAGHEVTLADLSRAPLPQSALEAADFIGFYLPMHTATRLFVKLIEGVRAANPSARLCAYGLYAPLNEGLLRQTGITSIIGGEFEQPLVDLVGEPETAPGVSQPPSLTSLARQRFLPPDRSGLPPLASYARLIHNGSTRTVGYTEASRGCKHRCRHCPVVPVYQGVFRVVQPEVVLEDIRRQVVVGAEHITFGDPDFFNGPGHAIKIVESLHREWPSLTYDVTIKIEHLLKHVGLLARLKTTGCLFITSAVESLDDAVLEKLAKGHTHAGFVQALALTRAAGIPLAPTFIPFSPWTSLESYRAFLRSLAELDLIDHVAPIQLAIRLLIPEGSLLLDLPEIRDGAGPFDPQSLCYPWRHEDPALDRLCVSLQDLIRRDERRHTTRLQTFKRIAELVWGAPFPVEEPRVSRAAIPYLTEPWYC